MPSHCATDSPRGAFNAVTDVPGVLVGHVSIRNGAVNTGITVVMPSDAAQTSMPWGLHTVGSGLEVTGLAVIEDFGLLGSPIFIAPLISVGQIYDGALTYAFSLSKGLPIGSGWPPVVIGFDDGAVCDPRERALQCSHALEAIRAARPGPVVQGSVGAGTSAVAFGYKGGVGTASRTITAGGLTWTVGILSLAHQGQPGDLGASDGGITNNTPAVISVVATDAPLLPRHLNDIAERAASGWDRIAPLAGSGIAVSFSTEAPSFSTNPPSEVLASLSAAAAEATAESIRNALLAAEPVVGRGGTRAETIPRALLNGP